MAAQRPERPLTGLPLAGRAALAPALVVTGLLTAAGLGYTLLASVGLVAFTPGQGVGLDAYGAVLAGEEAGEVWASAAFTVWVGVASTLLAAALALAAIGWLQRPRGGGRAAASGLLHVNLAIPHAVWAVALLVVLSQSGVIARLAASVGLIDAPADMPALVGDRFGIGIILHVATKEAPFVALVALAVSRGVPPERAAVARVLGARGLRWMRLVTLPTVLPAVAAASALVFAFVVGAYEAPAILGASAPRMLSVLGLDLFSDPDLARRPQAMALGVLMAVALLAALAAAVRLAGRRR